MCGGYRMAVAAARNVFQNLKTPQHHHYTAAPRRGLRTMATKLYVVYVSSTQLSVHTLFARPIAELFFCFLVCLFAVRSFCLLLFLALVVTATHEALRESKKNKVQWVEFETSRCIVQALISALRCISLTDYESGF